jgi:hypothetical protein
MMTDGELQRRLKEVSEGLDKLSGTDEPLTREQKKYRGKLLMRQNILSQIKIAKEKKQKDMELYHTTIYEILIAWGERHPVLMFFITNMLRARWGMAGFQRLS